ncbi:MAG: methyltransferase [Thermomicrobiales bacterium]
MTSRAMRPSYHGRIEWTNAGRRCGVYFADWYKKDVSLRWQGGTWSLAVAQELFSSHEVDSGSLLLLRSLDIDALPARGCCLDYGCGYGVLGLAIGAARPAWEIVLIDRDALAVAFSAHNATALGIPARGIVALDPLDPDPDRAGYDLLLWNVPGKAGASVLDLLTDEALDVLAVDGVLALVIVHPLAEIVRTAISRREDVALVHESAGSDHTVLHVRRVSGAPTGSRDGFADGVFDREPIEVVYGDVDYGLVPVIGLPQYDGPDQASLMMMDALSSLSLDAQGVQRAVVVRPGAGHLGMAVRSRWPAAMVTLVDRDLLALRSSARALDSGVEAFATPDFDGLETGEPFDLALATIPDQMRPPVMNRLLGDLIARVHPGGRLLIGGDSTEVSRFAGLAKKRAEVRVRDQRKRRGVSVAVIERREG